MKQEQMDMQITKQNYLQVAPKIFKLLNRMTSRSMKKVLILASSH